MTAVGMEHCGYLYEKGKVFKIICTWQMGEEKSDMFGQWREDVDSFSQTFRFNVEYSQVYAYRLS